MASMTGWRLFRRGMGPVALKTGLLVGTGLTAINQGASIVAGEVTGGGMLGALANYVVPFLVSSYACGSATQAVAAKPEPTLASGPPLATIEQQQIPEPTEDHHVDHAAELADQRQAFADSVTDAREKLVRMTDRAVANLDRAQSASGASVEAAELVQASRTEIDQMLHAVSDMIDAGRHINDVLTTVSGVAEKTNLLALNATIEAARAGETGRGFAVVAGEVKNLSVQSSTSVGESRAVVDRVVNTLAVVEASSAVIAQHFDQLTEQLHQIDELTGAIAEAAGAQPATVESIVRSLAIDDGEITVPV